MRTSFVLGLAASFASMASAHSVFTTLFIDDKNQGDGTCVRMPKDPDTATNPIASLSSTDMACGRDGQKAVAFTCSAQAGAKLTFEWRSTPDLSVPGSIDKSHAGPCAVYLKAVSNIMTDAAEGDGWFKIAEDGYDSESKQFCTEKLIANNGLQSIRLPAGLPTGYYLVRTELLALQNSPADPQFYVGCAQLFVQGSTSTPLSIPAEQKVSIPGYVAMGEPSVTFNIYANPLTLPYHIPGPKVFEVPSVGAFAADAAVTQQTQGVIPASALITNGNWAGIEVPDYTTEAGCWAASDNCYQQQKACYDSAPPSGSKGCEAWGDKCKSIQDACSAGKFTGPPNKGVILSANVNAPVPGPIPPAPAAEGDATPADPAPAVGTSAAAAPSASVSQAPKDTDSGSSPGTASEKEQGGSSGKGETSSEPTPTTPASPVASTPTDNGAAVTTSAAGVAPEAGDCGAATSKQDDSDKNGKGDKERVEEEEEEEEEEENEEEENEECDETGEDDNECQSNEEKRSLGARQGVAASEMPIDLRSAAAKKRHMRWGIRA